MYFPKGLDWEANQLITSLELYLDSIIESQKYNQNKTTYILEEGGFTSSAWFTPAESLIHQYVSPSPSESTEGSMS